jgi:hypothetical protein
VFPQNLVVRYRHNADVCVECMLSLSPSLPPSQPLRDGIQWTNRLSVRTSGLDSCSVWIVDILTSGLEG